MNSNKKEVISNKDELITLNKYMTDLQKTERQKYNQQRYIENKEQLILNSSKYYHARKLKDKNYSSILNERVKERNKQNIINSGKVPQLTRGRPKKIEVSPVEPVIKPKLGRPAKYFF